MTQLSVVISTKANKQLTDMIMIHQYVTILDILIQPKCVSIQYHCLMYHDNYYCYISNCQCYDKLATYHLPNSENVIFRHTTDHPGLIMVPSEVRNLCSMTTMNELQEHIINQLIK